MKIGELVQRLKDIRESAEFDEEVAHLRADELLLEFINDLDVKEAFTAIKKWYA